MEISEAKKILEGVLKELTINVKRVEVVAGDPHPILSVSTSDSGILIGLQGENLRALNYLVRKILESKIKTQVTKEHSFLIDVNGYHRKRIAQLQQQARILAERARMYKSEVVMDPLNPYERMIVHATFSEDPEIYTESTGMGKDRRIIFKYRKTEELMTAGDKALFSK